MTKTELQSRGTDAAKSFVERIGMTLTDEYRTIPDTFAAFDGDELVLVRVNVTRSGTAEPRVTKALEACAKAILADRVDVVALRVIAEDRALLRHYRAAWTREA